LEDGRYALDAIGRELRRAGYFYTTLKPAPKVTRQIFGGANSTTLLGAGEIIHGFNVNGNDEVVIRYQLDNGNPASDLQSSLCNPNALGYTTSAPDINTENIVLVRIFVQNGTLKCSAIVGGVANGIYNAGTNGNGRNYKTLDGSAYNGTYTTYPLINNVKKMRILYGLDDPATPEKTASVYVDNTNVTNWSDVVSVMLTLVLKSNKTGVAPSTPNSTMTINGGYSVTINNPKKKRLYRAFTTTIALRNVIL
uniref:PilW family protein n=1 Tax=Alcanivorax sp. TaxID=1872427 RepID=UPI0025887A25